MTVREAINSCLFEEMRRDKDVFVIGEEVPCPRKHSSAPRSSPQLHAAVLSSRQQQSSLERSAACPVMRSPCAPPAPFGDAQIPGLSLLSLGSC